MAMETDARPVAGRSAAPLKARDEIAIESMLVITKLKGRVMQV
jgi:hypothetical protein